MGDPLNSLDAEGYRWRPAVVPYRPRGLRPVKRQRAAAGQMLLPGLEAAEPEERAESAGPAGGVEMTCPNCGGSEFDDEGDCTRCWEPGVARRLESPSP